MRHISIVFLVFLLFYLGACSHNPPVQKQAYAKLSQTMVLDAPFQKVWKSIEQVMRAYVVQERDPEQVAPSQWNHLRERTIQTDWVFSQSQDKYLVVRIHDIPKRIPLQARFRFHVVAKRVLGGIEVRVNQQEQIQRLDEQGLPAGYDDIDEEEVDASRAHDLLESIQRMLLSL